MRKHLPLLLLLAAVAAVRYRYLDTVLERDEGEFAYGAQRILAGEVPYVSFHAMKLPGIYLAYAAILAAFGETARGIHLGLLVANMASVALVYAIGKRLVGNGIVPATAFALLTFSPGVQGTQAQAEHFVVLWALAGMLLLVYDRWLFVAGLCFGMAMLTKQHGALFGLAAMAYTAPRWRNVLSLAAGYMLPLAVTCATMYQLGAWEQFTFWTWTYPREYASQVPLSNWDKMFRFTAPWAFGWCAPLWAVGAVGIVRRWRALTPWAIAAVASVLPGFIFHPHYFLLLVPVAALGAGVCVRGGWSVVPVVAIAWCAVSLGRFYLPSTPEQITHKLYADGLFAEAPEIARYAAEHTDRGKPIGVLGSEPQICFYAQRTSASPHLYMYPLMEVHPYAERMQQEVMRQIEEAHPNVLVVYNDEASWLYHPGAPQEIAHWMAQFISDYYYQVGRVESVNGRPAKFSWTAAELAEQPTSHYVSIYRRKAGL